MNIGISQAKEVHALWTHELQHAAPIPTRFFSSPLSRAAHTLNLTFAGLANFDTNPPLIMEGLRETIGLHTCDKRSSKSDIHAAFPTYAIEAGFAEEDELWRADYRETVAERDARVKIAIDRIFSEVKDPYVSIVAHGGVISSTLRVMNHAFFEVGTGGVIPMLIKATFSHT
ncbi:hypothetical protein FRB96_001440 [Tulasnella sp. 330]|nr:hypothetical protein FRB96_001440 [Tulasnella sp. 330]